ncbi:triose-phosphate isomerase [Mesomycoplasma ovipneumoniae]|uniref:Triosephosphate isomerase n=1 Tax=Mesomycoplasma ovipneumoniae TaxID=29562 RepID=A0AAJ2P4I9_9BACT|nr:triose-phosphate isomerase [Mesomycoplasma ovipneumoniae]MDW2835268.1 triose-phosphate isomerase [Mesomycoplasma ovipneumoniae]MDW2852338.1 triose-phosphate isomerase [Mesomycoplasma ovipneumoniae]MDW2870555.1 triose-phosphate isomerase [Mesomycoplasma ovipneumoniae]MDW2890966.1 triose-phosphate isomerase [Mesomycoplasma ovipneumoniae]
MKKIVIGNWKMNQIRKEFYDFLFEFDTLFNKNPEKVAKTMEFAIAPPFTLLSEISKSQVKTLKIAAQNVSQFESGAYTGEISAKMLKDLGVSYIIIGHSERRMFFNETDEVLAQKIWQAQKYSITPVFCVGETLEQYENKLTEKVIISQINAVKHVLDFEKVIIAYEPIWAIGTGKTASAEIANEISSLIKEEFGKNVRVIYGGSVNSQNYADFLNSKLIDGILVGGASLDPKQFYKMVKFSDACATNPLNSGILEDDNHCECGDIDLDE